MAGGELMSCASLATAVVLLVETTSTACTCRLGVSSTGARLRCVVLLEGGARSGAHFYACDDSPSLMRWAWEVGTPCYARCLIYNALHLGSG